ncbi:hypothetical protein [Rhizobium miluonense]|nr:hypothetical protein [Rhizobium miluonense]
MTLDRKLIESYFLPGEELAQLKADIQRTLASLAKRDSFEIMPG